MLELSQLNLATNRFIMTDPLILDCVFHEDPLFGYLRDAIEDTFKGGRQLVETNIEYDGETAAAYNVGDTFDTSIRQAETSFALPMQHHYGNVSANLEDSEIFNKGPLMVYDFLKTRISRAYRTMGATMAMELYLNGSRPGYTSLMTGLAEALNDGTTASWDGSIYTTYGDKTRNTVQLGTALNSRPYVTSTTSINLRDLETSFTRASIGEGDRTPNIGVTTYNGYSSIKAKFQPQQRFNDTQDPKLGFNALSFNTASLMRSRYCPGTEISGNQTNEITRIANAYLNLSSKGVVTAYPTVTTESLFWLNARRKYMRFLVTDSKIFGFGTSGWKGGRNDNQISLQTFATTAFFVRAPRYHCQVYGFTL